MKTWLTSPNQRLALIAVIIAVLVMASLLTRACRSPARMPEMESHDVQDQEEQLQTGEWQEAPETPSDKPDMISDELGAIRQREQGRRELLENLRRHARENPDDPYALSLEEIDELEASGADIH